MKMKKKSFIGSAKPTKNGFAVKMQIHRSLENTKFRPLRVLTFLNFLSFQLIWNFYCRTWASVLDWFNNKHQFYCLHWSRFDLNGQILQSNSSKSQHLPKLYLHLYFSACYPKLCLLHYHADLLLQKQASAVFHL